jgi:hypothetical protein
MTSGMGILKRKSPGAGLMLLSGGKALKSASTAGMSGILRPPS